MCVHLYDSDLARVCVCVCVCVCVVGLLTLLDGKGLPVLALLALLALPGFTVKQVRRCTHAHTHRESEKERERERLKRACSFSAWHLRQSSSLRSVWLCVLRCVHWLLCVYVCVYVMQICNWAQLRASADLLVQADLKKIKS